MNQSMKSLPLLLLGLLFGNPFMPTLRAQSACVALTPAEARAIAKEAYIYGFPLVDNYRVMHSYFVDRDSEEFKTPCNQIHNEARVYTPNDRTIQTPNSDTPYSQIGTDLRAEPLVISVPEVEEGRYYSLEQTGGPGKFEVPAWDPVSQKRVRDALNVLADTLPDKNRTFGVKGEVDPVRHLLGAASGWGGKVTFYIGRRGGVTVDVGGREMREEG
jgi:hypothetical protein